MKKLVLIAAMLIGFFGANATTNVNFNPGTFVLSGSTGVLTSTKICADTMWWYTRICLNSSFTGTSVLSNVSTPYMDAGIMPVSESRLLTGAYLSGCYIQIISYKPDPSHTYMIGDTTSPIYLSGITTTSPLTVSGTAVSNMEGISFTVTGNAGGASAAVMSVTVFTDLGHSYGFAPQNYSISGSTNMTVSGNITATLAPCMNYYLDYKVYDPATGNAVHYYLTMPTKCAELESKSVNSCGRTINYFYKYGSMTGNRLTYTITYSHAGSVQQTQTFSNVPGCGCIVNTSSSIDVYTSGWYTVSACGYDASGHNVFASDLNVYVACDYTSVEEIIQHQTKPGKIFLIDMTGRCVKTCEGMYLEEINKVKSSNALPPGIYAIKFVSEEGNYSDKLIIVQ